MKPRIMTGIYFGFWGFIIAFYVVYSSGGRRTGIEEIIFFGIGPLVAGALLGFILSPLFFNPKDTESKPKRALFFRGLLGGGILSLLAWPMTGLIMASFILALRFLSGDFTDSAFGIKEVVRDAAAVVRLSLASGVENWFTVPLISFLGVILAFRMPRWLKKG